MSKRALIIAAVIGLTVIITGVFFLLGREEPSPPAEGENLVTVSRPPEQGGWQLIHHPVFNISIKVPPAWKVTTFEEKKGRVEAYFEGPGVDALLSLYDNKNISGSKPEDFLLQDKAYDYFSISRGQIKGVGYVIKETSEGESEGKKEELVKDSYILVNRYFVGDKTPEISCNLSGPNYGLMIPTCEEIAKNLQFTE